MNRKIQNKNIGAGENVPAQRYSMVNIPNAEPGNKKKKQHNNVE
jgi:hypothetical protein